VCEYPDISSPLVITMMTSALQRDTPKAFMTDLAETELWAEAVSKDRPPAPGSATETKSTASLWSGNIFDSGSGRNVTAGEFTRAFDL